MYTNPMQLTETFGDYRGIASTKEDDMFGIEIEIEGKNIVPIADTSFQKFWVGVPDNSLRVMSPGDQAIEYRFVNPLNLKNTESALDQLEFHLSRPKVEVYESDRTSVHVHLNFVNERMSTLYNFITLAVIFDELFVSQNGNSRIGNNFCLRAKDAEGLIVQIADSVRNSGGLGHLSPDHRYSSINVMSLFKFGTIEFRSLECTISKHRIFNWVKTLQCMKEAARNFANPMEIMTQFSQVGPERFFLNVLGSQALRYMRVVERHRMLFEGLRLVQELANAASWDPSERKSSGRVVFKPSPNIIMEDDDHGEDDDEEFYDDDDQPEDGGIVLDTTEAQPAPGTQAWAVPIAPPAPATPMNIHYAQAHAAYMQMLNAQAGGGGGNGGNS